LQNFQLCVYFIYAQVLNRSESFLLLRGGFCGYDVFGKPDLIELVRSWDVYWYWRQ